MVVVNLEMGIQVKGITLACSQASCEQQSPNHAGICISVSGDAAHTDCWRALTWCLGCSRLKLLHGSHPRCSNLKPCTCELRLTCPVEHPLLAGWWSCCKTVSESFGSLTLETNRRMYVCFLNHCRPAKWCLIVVYQHFSNCWPTTDI